MNLQISSPCPKSWDDLVGDHRIRYCGECRLNVYNLAEMPRVEVEALVRSTEGRLCGRLYVRDDRKATTRDCGGTRRRQVLRRWLTAAGVLLLVGFTWVSRSAESPDRSTLPNWARSVLDIIDPPKQQPPPPRAIMGKMICPQPPAPPPTVPAPGPNGG
jgi:hypothetical protein